MLKARIGTGIAVGLVATLLFAGCTSNDPADTAATGNTATAGSDDHDHDHAHPSHGPHGGDLIELGNEEYHGEVVHDEKAGTVTIYLLDSHAEKAVAIAAEEITINMKHDEEAYQFTLAAQPDDGDPEGQSSRFISSEPELARDLDHDDAEAHLVVTINDKQYRGKIAHNHAHGDHDHDHDHGKKGDAPAETN